MYNYTITQRGKCQQVIMPDNWQQIAEGVGSPTIRKLTYHKYINTRIVAALNDLRQRELANTIYACGTWAEITVDSKNREHISRANFCRQRLCQICAWRRSARFFAEMVPVLHAVKKLGYSFIFVTLTMRNCTAQEAPAAVEKLLKSWDRLMKRERYKTGWSGFMRSIEVTYNAAEHTYHPHIHTMIAVKNGYFVKTNKNYVTTRQLAADWKTALGVDYTPIVWIQSVRDKKGNRSTETVGGALETMKYAFKVSFKTISSETVDVIQSALRNRRLISFGGIIAKVRTELKKAKEEQLCDEPVDDSIIVTLYRFHPDGWSVEDVAGEYTADDNNNQISIV